jgi:trehalose/maltose hydrolase-like predicted phosphorylase
LKYGSLAGEARLAGRHDDAVLPVLAGRTTRDFERLGYDYRADAAMRTVAYYDRRTSHGSTLSHVTHAGVLAGLDPDSSWDRFLTALRSDAEDIQGGTSKEGIHVGVMSGTLDVVQRCYAGMDVRDGVLYFDPRLPSQLGSLSFPVQFRDAPILITLTADCLTLAIHPEGVSHPITAGVPGDLVSYPRVTGRYSSSSGT